MTLELADLEVRHGSTEPFEEAFSQAKDIIARAPGFVGLELLLFVGIPVAVVVLAVGVYRAARR